jgi:hypothetical protein
MAIKRLEMQKATQTTNRRTMAVDMPKRDP